MSTEDKNKNVTADSKQNINQKLIMPKRKIQKMSFQILII